MNVLETHVRPRGFRMLRKIPRLTRRRSSRSLVARFGDLQEILKAPVEELAAVEGVGPARARRHQGGLAATARASTFSER